MTFKLGLLLGLSIIITIGVQNLFVIQQAARNEHTFLAAGTCFIADVVLIILGAAGVGVIILEFPVLKSILLVFGIIFLVRYAYASIKRGWSGGIQMNLQSSPSGKLPFSSIILLGLSFSLLNPAAILDTVMIIGGGANQYQGMEKIHFLLGAISASLLWFFSLAMVTRCLAARISGNRIWRVLDFVSGGLMFAIAIKFGMLLI